MIKNCVVCQREFVTYPSKILLGRGKYCSKQCCNSVTLWKKGQSSSPATQIKKGDKLALGIKKDTVWNKGTKGICKPNNGTWKKGQRAHPQTEFKRGTHPRWLGGVSCVFCHTKTNSNRDYWKQYFVKEVMTNAPRRD